MVVLWITLDSGARERGMERCLGTSNVGQKTSVKIQHAQEATELIG
jgi:hypothetical protein